MTLKSHPAPIAKPLIETEFFCLSCNRRHCPTAEHPICLEGTYSSHLHEPIRPELFIDHRGWRFFYPFYCFACGIRVCPHQFAFSRSCGACDCSTSRTPIFKIGDRRTFVGKFLRLEREPHDGHLDDLGLTAIDVHSPEAKQLMERKATEMSIKPEQLRGRWDRMHRSFVPPRPRIL